jgi:hypothetical protein
VPEPVGTSGIISIKTAVVISVFLVALGITVAVVYPGPNCNLAPGTLDVPHRCVSSRLGLRLAFVIGSLIISAGLLAFADARRKAAEGGGANGPTNAG